MGSDAPRVRARRWRLGLLIASLALLLCVLAIPAAGVTPITYAAEGATIGGNVVSGLSSVSIAGVDVVLWRASADGAWSQTATYKSYSWDVSWGYEFRNVAEGRYRVTAHDPNGYFRDLGYPAGSGLDDAEDIVIGLGDQVSVSATMTPILGTLTGVIRDSETNEPLPGMDVALWATGEAPRRGVPVPGAVTRTDGNGRYSFEWEGPTVAAWASDPTGLYLPMLDMIFFGAIDVPLPPGGVVECDVLLHRQHRLTVFVVDAATGEPIPGITAREYRGWEATTGPDGSFSILSNSTRSWPAFADPSGWYLPLPTQTLIHNNDTTLTIAMTLDPGPPPDLTPPHTSCDATSSYVTSAKIMLAASDDAGGSGVALTRFVLDGGAVSEGTTLTVATLGSHTLEYWSVDVAGNVEPSHSVTFTVVLPKATVYTPVAPTSMRRGYRSTIYGYLTPKHSSGTYLVTLRFYKRNAVGEYVYHHSVRARRYYYSSTKTRYRAYTSLPHTGRWRVRAVHECTAHSLSYSGYDYITVR